MMGVIDTHNGIYTVTSKATGEHRTFCIRTQADNSQFAPGERIVALLVGPDNEQDYQSFGFVKDGGRINVWKRHRGGMFEKLARMLEHLEEHERAGRVEVLHEGRCRRCNRLLTTPESIRSGIGPVCERRKPR
jgi:hypothetical protein